MSSDPQPAAEIDDLRGLTFGFDDLPLEHFRGLSAAQIEAHEGIGPKFRKRIEESLAQLDELLRAAGQPIPEPAPEPAPATPDGYLEPTAPGNGGPLTLILVVVGLLLVLAIVAAAGGRDKQSRRLAEELQQTKTSLVQAQASATGLSGDLAVDATSAADKVYQKAHGRNLGEALEQLDHVDRALKALGTARTVAPAPADQAPKLAAALQAAEAARTTLKLTTPQTQDQIEAACKSLYDAVQALQPQEVKG